VYILEQGFIDILKQIVKEQGNAAYDRNDYAEAFNCYSKGRIRVMRMPKTV
jgi:hypothetical protein